jgi:hypothetical protein
MKACEQCAADRVIIGRNYKNVSVLSRAIGLILIYLPIITFPFIVLSAYWTYYSLILCGAKNVKKWGDYLPDRASHRYTMKNQVVMDGSFKLSLAQSKLYWILNCTWYCPSSVALFEWHSYLVKVVENWWCPFTHGTKETYKNGSIDQSFWHIYPDDSTKLHKDDKVNPIFTDEHDKDLKKD